MVITANTTLMVSYLSRLRMPQIYLIPLEDSRKAEPGFHTLNFDLSLYSDRGQLTRLPLEATSTLNLIGARSIYYYYSQLCADI